MSGGRLGLGSHSWGQQVYGDKCTELGRQHVHFIIDDFQWGGLWKGFVFLCFLMFLRQTVVPDSLLTPWILARQAPLSMGFSRQEYWSGLPSPPPVDLPDPGIKLTSLMSPVLMGGFFTTSATWEALVVSLLLIIWIIWGVSECLNVLLPEGWAVTHPGVLSEGWAVTSPGGGQALTLGHVLSDDEDGLLFGDHGIQPHQLVVL